MPCHSCSYYEGKHTVQVFTELSSVCTSGSQILACPDESSLETAAGNSGIHPRQQVYPSRHQVLEPTHRHQSPAQGTAVFVRHTNAHLSSFCRRWWRHGSIVEVSTRRRAFRTTLHQLRPWHENCTLPCPSAQPSRFLFVASSWRTSVSQDG